MKRFTVGASHTAMLVNLASTPRIGRVPIRIIMKRKPAEEQQAS